MHKEILIDFKEEKKIRAELEKRTDAEALRMKRFLDMPDLTRTEGSPIHELTKKIVELPEFSGFEVVRVPEIVPVRESFDLFNFPADHPARSRSDTYYVNDANILRTHTTIMWYYYLPLSNVKAKVVRGEPVGVLSYGKVYRKDEIDRHHMNVFHQMDGLYLCRKPGSETSNAGPEKDKFEVLLPGKEEKKIGQPELEEVLAAIAKAIYGPGIKYRFNKDTFPYTDPSIEMEVDMSGKWVEVLGAGVVQAKVLDNLGADSKIWNGWAFGFGLERLAILSMELPDIRLLWSKDERVKRQLKLGNKYTEVSKYPPITRDISFIVGKEFVPNNYFDLIRDIGGELVEEVLLIDKYENTEKFGPDKVSYAYRIVYRSNERTLTIVEIEPLQERITEETKKQFGGEVR